LPLLPLKGYEQRLRCIAQARVGQRPSKSAKVKTNVKSNARVKIKIIKCKSKNKNKCSYKIKSNVTLNLNYCIDLIRTLIFYIRILGSTLKECMFETNKGHKRIWYYESDDFTTLYFA
jgi:hypothetical protein